MKTGDIIFWGVLSVIAAFYLMKGNHMHQEKWDMIEQKFQKETSNQAPKVLENQPQ